MRRVRPPPAKAGADGRDRVGQDVHDGQRDPGRCRSRRWSSRTTRRWRLSSTPSSRSSFRTTPSTTSSATTTTISRKPTSRSATSTSKRTRRSTTRSIGCGWRRPAALVSRRDVIVVASVSSIYGLGSPEDYRSMMVSLERGGRDRTATRCWRGWSTSSTSGTTSSFERGKFRVRGDCVEIWPSYEEFAFRIELWGDEVDQLSLINPTSGETIAAQEQLFIYPAKHFVMPEERIAQAVLLIKEELDEQLEKFREQGKLLEAQRLNARTRFDIEMLQEVGLLPGHRELQPAAVGAAAGRAARYAVQFLSRRLPAVRRRIARHRAADPGDVRRRPQPQADAGRARVPAAQRAGQSAAEIRGMGAADQPGRLRLGDAGRLRTGADAAARWSSRSFARPGLLDPVIEVVAGPRPGAASAGSRFAHGRRSASACWSPTLTKRLAEDLSAYF